MYKCENCAHINPPDAAICGRCGSALTPLPTQQAGGQTVRKSAIKRLLKFLSRLETQPFEQEQATKQLDPATLDDSQHSRHFDVSDFPPGTDLVFTMLGTYEIVVEAPQEEIWLGRFGGNVPVQRDAHVVNLTDYAAYRLGVSRLHATMRPTKEGSLEVIDLASSNGTWLNGQLLIPYQVYHVYDGDELQLGQLKMEVKFVYH